MIANGSGNEVFHCSFLASAVYLLALFAHLVSCHLLGTYVSAILSIPPGGQVICDDSYSTTGLGMSHLVTYLTCVL